MSYSIGKLKYWKGRKLSALHRLKIKKAMAATKRKRSESMRKAWQEGRLKIWNRGKHLSSATKEKISEIRKKQAGTAENRKETSQFFRKYWKENPEKLQDMLDKTINLWKKDVRLRERINRKISRMGTMRFRNPSERVRMRKAVKEYWKNHPNLDEIWSLRMYLYYAFHRKARDKLLKNQRNPFRPHLRTKQGFLVRSEGEKIVANALFAMKEKAEYESQGLFFAEDSCVPDFWLPKRKKLIEYYGGHPKSWKKKVIKNKLYAKYKIPVIGITPAELIDIASVLRREFRKDSSSFQIEKFQNPLVMANKQEMKLVLNIFPKLKEILIEKGAIKK